MGICRMFADGSEIGQVLTLIVFAQSVLISKMEKVEASSQVLRSLSYRNRGKTPVSETHEKRLGTKPDKRLAWLAVESALLPNVLRVRPLEGMQDLQKHPVNALAEAGSVTVFGGSGFLGRRIVQRLLSHGSIVRAASRHVARAARGPAQGETFTVVKADILDHGQVAAAVSGASTVINAVSLYSERGDMTFKRIHVEAASRLAAAARDAGAQQFIQISGIGSDARSEFSYISARGRGEAAVTAAFPNATIVRPAVMTGSDDVFLTMIVRLVRILPAYPLFGNGDTRLQPAFVEDVAEAIARLASGPADAQTRQFELAGPRIWTYRDLVREVSRLLDVRTRLMRVPFRVWHALATFAEFLPGAPLTRNQVELMQVDNVADPELPGFRDLGIEPRDIGTVVQAIRERS